MTVIKITVGPDELQGLNAVAEADKPGSSDGADLERIAGDVLRSGLVAKLEALALSRPPSSQHVRSTVASDSNAKPSTKPSSRQGTKSPSRLLRPVRENEQVKMGIRVTALFIVALLLWGGYVERWSWTGFTANGQLWNWLNLLLLPLAFATLPLWIQHSQHISRLRQTVYAFLIVAFAGFVFAGYLVPLGWTGFPGNKLWDWLTLIVLPATLITVVTWRTTGRETKMWHRTLLGALLIGWLITLIGGYAWSWGWTGYEGNTLWDWVNLLLLPTIFPIIVAPAAVAFVTGNVEKRVEEERDKVAAELAGKEPTLPVAGESAPSVAS